VGLPTLVGGEHLRTQLQKDEDNALPACHENCNIKHMGTSWDWEKPVFWAIDQRGNCANLERRQHLDELGGPREYLWLKADVQVIYIYIYIYIYICMQTRVSIKYEHRIVDRTTQELERRNVRRHLTQSDLNLPFKNNNH
jgi:hypothetical protein